MRASLLILCLQLLTSFNSVNGQIHDFDSLYNLNDQFREVAGNVLDTLDIFNSDELLHIKLISDFKGFRKNKFDNNFQQASLEYFFNDTVMMTRNIRIKPRGNFRRENCSNPPILFNFPQHEVGIRQFNEFNELKFVDNCRDGISYEQYLFLEYYAYKIYNLITPYSFRVKLLKVEFIDTGRKNKSRINYAFVIEDEKQMAQRLNAINFLKQNIHSENTNREMTTILGIYQYMIGNTDWSIPALHNIKLIKVNDVSLPEPIAIPYDFDYSGIVNASYAIPGNNLPIKEVRERYFLGFCRESEEFEIAFQVFNQKKDQVIDMLESSDFLENRFRNETINFLEQFYAIINNRGAVGREFIQNCR